MLFMYVFEFCVGLIVIVEIPILTLVEKTLVAVEVRRAMVLLAMVHRAEWVAVVALALAVEEWEETRFVGKFPNKISIICRYLVIL